MLMAMVLWRAVAPDSAYTSPATYSCLIGASSSKRKYSSTVITRTNESRMFPRYARPRKTRKRMAAERGVLLRQVVLTSVSPREHRQRCAAQVRKHHVVLRRKRRRRRFGEHTRSL